MSLKNIIIKFDKKIFGSLIINTYIKIKYYFKLKKIISSISKSKNFDQINHNLEKELIISLTSYPPRFNTLPLVLDSIQNQSIKADKIELWIEENDKHLLNKNIFKFKNINVRFCENNLYSYKKIIPAYRENSDRYIITFDDDIIYPKNSLECLIKKSKEFPNDVVSNRVHRIKLKNHLPDRYNDWFHNFQKTDDFIFLTGAGGVLYSPNCFHKDFLNAELFNNLCPTNDDIWLNWMIKLNKVNIRFSEIKTNFELIKIIKTGLYKINVKKENNDIQINAMINKYGFPYK